MQEILFATTNKGKFLSMKKRLEPFSINLIQANIPLIEPQADTCSEIAEVKAKQAYAQLKRPVLVDDSTFHIPALNGFPGPYVKYVLSTLGGNGILRTAKGISSRHAYFEGTLTFATNKNTFKSFIDNAEVGTLSETWQGPIRPEAWSELWNIFIPKGTSKVLAELTDEDRDAMRKEYNIKDSYQNFAEWLANDYFKGL